MRKLPSLLSLVAVLGSSCAQDEPTLPEGPAIRFEPAIAGTFDRPLFVAFAANDADHAYVVCQPGQVFRTLRSADKEERAVFLDLHDKVFLDHNEEGLLGFAFDPDYAENGHVWAYWSERTEVTSAVMANGKSIKSNRRSVVARYATRAGDAGRVADPASELRVLEVFQPFGNHNGGTIVFGPDGMLYIALGDGGAANDPFANSQSKRMLLGKVLRIDVRAASAAQPYAIPKDNPFVGEEGARGEIWCYGLRNPWRIAFDRATGDLWCGDVGQNRIEEVDRLVKGGNYGWNGFEASEVFQLRRDKTPPPEGALFPVAEYPHSQGLSVTGGHVYRGTRIAGLAGWFVYGDYASMRMWACRVGDGGKPEVVTLARAPLMISSFAEEPDGELLMTGFAGKDGRVFRLAPAAAAPATKNG